MNTPRSRQSYEILAVNRLHIAAAEFPSLQLFKGQAFDNKLDIPTWNLSKSSQFQFGDLRIEAPHCTIVVEVESAGGLTNLILALFIHD